MKRSLGAQTLLYPTPVLVVGTYDPQGKPNVMTASWAGVCCSRPPCVSVALRRATYTHGNIVARKAFTLGIPSETQVRAADFFGMVSGREVDKLARAKLTPVRSTLVDAPYVDEFPVVLECRLVHTAELGSHTQFVGEILDVKVDAAVLDETGQSNILKVRPLVFTPDTQAYHGIGPLVARAFSVSEPA